MPPLMVLSKRYIQGYRPLETEKPSRNKKTSLEAMSIARPSNRPHYSVVVAFSCITCLLKSPNSLSAGLRVDCSEDLSPYTGHACIFPSSFSISSSVSEDFRAYQSRQITQLRHSTQPRTHLKEPSFQRPRHAQ
jgi:hypothetical protein